MVTRAAERIRRFAQRLGHGVAHPEQELSRLQRLVVLAYDLARHGSRQLVRDNAPLMAAALAYRTLFSAVPVLVLALVVARSFYGEEGIRKAFSRMMELSGISEISLPPVALDAAAGSADPAVTAAQQQVVISQLVEQWVNNAVHRMTTLNYGAITVISIGVFIYAAIILLVQVEESFNTVCQAARGRRLLVRLTTYWTLLTLGSVGFAGTVVLGRSWVDALSSLPAWLAWLGTPIQVTGRLAIVWLLLLFAYRLMPNTRVLLRPAAIGALVAAVLWELGKALLVWFIRKTAAGQLEVYGSLALVPILLFWLYCTWHVVLFGLEVTWTIQTVGELRLRKNDPAPQITAIDPTAAVAVMQHLASAFATGGAMRLDQLSQATRIPEALVQRLIAALADASLVHRVIRGADEEAYALARAPSEIGLDRVLAAAMTLTPPAAGSDAPPGASVISLREKLTGALRGTTLAEHRA